MPNTFSKGFDVKEVEAGKYGHSLLFWNWKDRTLEKKIDLGPDRDPPDFAALKLSPPRFSPQFAPKTAG